jgi:hypothetical protein
MKKNIFVAFLLSILFSCVKQNTQTRNLATEKSVKNDSITLQQTSEVEITKLEIELYDFDTILKNDYHLSYRVYRDISDNEQLQSLTLVKGKEDIKQISVTSYPMLHKNLGYIGADFGKTFLFVQSYGSGNPHEIQLIEKENGTVLEEGVLIDSNELEKVVLYIKNENEPTAKLILFDLKNNIKKVITDFNNLKCSHIGGLRNCIALDTVTKNEIRIKTTSEEDNITKIYKR